MFYWPYLRTVQWIKSNTSCFYPFNSTPRLLDRCIFCLSYLPVRWCCGLTHSASCPGLGLTWTWHRSPAITQQRATACTPPPAGPLWATHSTCPSLTCRDRGRRLWGQGLRGGFSIYRSEWTHINGFSCRRSLWCEAAAAHHLLPPTAASDGPVWACDPRPFWPDWPTQQLLTCRKSNQILNQCWSLINTDQHWPWINQSAVALSR